MWLPWDYALLLAAICATIALLGRGTGRSTIAAVGREATILSVLYAFWQLAGRLSVMQIDGAVARGQWIWDFQRAIRIPDEAAWQAAVLDQGWFIQTANIYYGGAHVPGMGIFLVWLFFAHRDAYPRWRNALAGTTAMCLVLQLLPVAPPRLVPEIDMVDTGIAYGQSVYATFGGQIAGQLQAMPSIHVAWAVLIAAATWALGGTWARWIGVGHAVATSYVVVITANHYWLDGIVAAAFLAAVWALLGVIDRRSSREVTSDPVRSEAVAAR